MLARHFAIDQGSRQQSFRLATDRAVNGLKIGGDRACCPRLRRATEGGMQGTLVVLIVQCSNKGRSSAEEFRFVNWMRSRPTSPAPRFRFASKRIGTSSLPTLTKLIEHLNFVTMR